MGYATLPILCLTQAELDARTKAIGSRQLVFNTTTGEMRMGRSTGGGNWAQCVPIGRRADTEVVAATTGNITIATGLNAGDTIDGVVLAAGDLVLVKDQSTAHQNGVYVAGASPARAAAYDTYDEHIGKTVYVQGGTTNKYRYYNCAAATGGTLNTTSIVWEVTVPSAQSDPTWFNNLPQRDPADLDAAARLLFYDNLSGQLVTVELNALVTFIQS
jgi:hypothetical protein